MIKCNTLTFEQIEPTFHKWAKILSNKDFEYWELINSAWAYGKVRFLPQSRIKYASLRIRYDMIDYMRSVTHNRKRQRRVKKGETFPFIHKFSDITIRSPAEDGSAFETTLRAKVEDIEQKDLIKYLTSHPSLSRREKLIMKLRYIQGYTLAEIGKVCGTTQSRIAQIHSNLIERFRSLDYSKVI